MGQIETKLLTILSAGLVVVSAVWFLGEGRTKEGQPWDREASVPVWSIEKDQIVKVRAKRGEQVFEVSREEGDWMIRLPKRVPAAPSRMLGMVDDLADLDLGIQVQDEKLEFLGLDESQRCNVDVFLRDGTEHSLEVGFAGAIGWTTYVRADDGPVVLVPGHLGTTVCGKPETYRDIALVRFPLAQVAGAKIVSEHGTLRIYSDAAGWWIDGYARADLDRVDELMVGLSRLQMDGFMDGVAEEGIEAPVFQVEVKLKDGSIRGFDVGAAMPMGRLVRNHWGITGHIQHEALTLLNQGPDHVGEKRAFPISEEQLVETAGTLGDQAFDIKNVNDQWIDANEKPAEGFIQALLAVKTRIRREPVVPSAASWGEVRLQRQGAPEMVITLGAEVIDGKWRVAADKAGGQPYLVIEEELQTALQSLSSQ
jgi:hypothetical protein